MNSIRVEVKLVDGNEGIEKHLVCFRSRIDNNRETKGRALLAHCVKAVRNVATNSSNARYNNLALRIERLEDAIHSQRFALGKAEKVCLYDHSCHGWMAKKKTGREEEASVAWGKSIVSEDDVAFGVPGSTMFIHMPDGFESHLHVSLVARSSSSDSMHMTTFISMPKLSPAVIANSTRNIGVLPSTISHRDRRHLARMFHGNAIEDCFGKAHDVDDRHTSTRYDKATHSLVVKTSKLRATDATIVTVAMLACDQ